MSYLIAALLFIACIAICVLANPSHPPVWRDRHDRHNRDDRHE